MIRRGLACALLLASTAACTGSSPANEAAAAPGLAVTLFSEDAIDGHRPRLTLSCGQGGNSFFLALPFAATSDGNGAFKLDDGSPFQIELMAMGDGHWAPRVEHSEETRLAHSMAAAQNIYFTGPLGQTERVIRWDLRRLGPQLTELRAACASPVRP